jgi:hypothetical protein
LQTKAKGNSEQIVYAETFYRRAAAEKAVKAANDRMGGIKAGNVVFGTTRPWAGMWRLPIDIR